jgi:hypothetical protein
MKNEKCIMNNAAARRRAGAAGVAVVSVFMFEKEMAVRWWLRLGDLNRLDSI